MADAPSPPPATDAADVVSPPLAGNLGAAPPVVEAAATTPLVGGPLVVLLASGVTRVGPPLRGQAHHPTTRTALAGLAQVRTAPAPAADASVAEPVVDPALAPLDATAAAAVSYRADDFAGAQVVVRSVIVRAAPAPADAVAVLVDRAARAEQVLLVLDRLAGDRSALVVATRTGPRLLPITIGQPGAIAVEPTLDLDLGWPGELAVELVGPYTGRLARLGVQGDRFDPHALRAALAQAGRPTVVRVSVAPWVSAQLLVEVITEALAAGVTQLTLDARRGRGAAGYGVGSGGRPRTTRAVQYRPPTVTGPLDLALVRRFAHVAEPAFTACYQVRLAAEPTLAGTITLEFTVDADGAVRGARAHGVDAEVASCMADVAASWKLPAQAGRVPTQVSYPLLVAPPTALRGQRPLRLPPPAAP
jgi:hypothetical protein